jgi:hypothetical protein
VRRVLRRRGVGFAFTISHGIDTVAANRLLAAVLADAVWAMLFWRRSAHVASSSAPNPVTMIFYFISMSQAWWGDVHCAGGGHCDSTIPPLRGVVFGTIVGVFVSSFPRRRFVELVGGWGQGPSGSYGDRRSFRTCWRADVVPAISVVACRPAKAPESVRALVAKSRLIIASWRVRHGLRVARLGLGGIPRCSTAAAFGMGDRAPGAIGNRPATLVVALLEDSRRDQSGRPFVASRERQRAVDQLVFICLHRFVSGGHQAAAGGAARRSSTPATLKWRSTRGHDDWAGAARATRTGGRVEPPFGAMLRVVHPTISWWSRGHHRAIEHAGWDSRVRVVHTTACRWVMGKGEVLRDEASSRWAWVSRRHHRTQAGRGRARVRGALRARFRSSRTRCSSAPDGRQIIDVNDAG